MNVRALDRVTLTAAVAAIAALSAVGQAPADDEAQTFADLAADVAGGRYAGLAEVDPLTDKQKTRLAAALGSLRTDIGVLCGGKTYADRQADLDDTYDRARKKRDPEALSEIMKRRGELAGSYDKLLVEGDAAVLKILTAEQGQAWMAERLFQEVTRGLNLDSLADDKVDQIRQRCTNSAPYYAAAASTAERKSLVQKLRRDVTEKVLTTPEQRRRREEAKARHEAVAKAAAGARAVAGVEREAAAAVAQADKGGKAPRNRADAGKKAGVGKAEAIVRAAMNPDAKNIESWTDKTFSWTHPNGTSRVFCYVTHARGYESYLSWYSPGMGGEGAPGAAAPNAAEPPGDPSMYVVFVLIKGGHLLANGSPGAKGTHKGGPFPKWDGYLVVQDGTAHTTTTFRCEGRDGPIPTKSDQSVAWLSWTSWSHDAFLIRLELPSPETYITVRAGGLTQRFKTRLIPADLEAKLQAQAKAKVRPKGRRKK